MRDSLYIEAYSLQKHMVKSFIWMAIGLIITAAVAFVMYDTGAYFRIMYSLSQSGLSLLLLLPMFVQLGVAIYLSSRLYKMSTVTSKVLFISYSVITGITFSTLPLIYGMDQIFTAFAFSSVLFICLAIIGNTIKLDLTKYSALIVGALFTLIITSVIGIFLRIPSLDMFICYAGILLFLFITAYDIQKMKRNYEIARQDETMLEKLAIYGAFDLYLDFINIFLYVLRLLGKRR
ncbi:Bax inhibitor-1/YccA family protein [Anaerorhabdus sp.]|uniref:Bax inhibitor-1/YccA family protein n=1 Tax=Anaerorhabdus sp. TaxID=1872524 RepID=UPI002FCC448A